MTINEREYMNRFAGEFKIKGSELVAKYCPICGGGKHRDKETFALNEEKHTYKCQRGSCGAAGTFKQLAEERGEVAEYYLNYLESKGIKNKVAEIQKKDYTQPRISLKAADDDVVSFFNTRGISRAVTEKYVYTAIGRGKKVAAFKFFDDKKHCMTKFRYLNENSSPKEITEANGLAVLWNIENIDFEKPVILTEGMIDALSCIEAGCDNVVSVPMGCNNFKWIDNNYDKIQKIEKWVLYMDNDEAGEKMKNELIVKLGNNKISIVEHDLKDANEELMLYGHEAVKEFISNARPLPLNGIVDIADVGMLDMSKVEKVKTGFSFIDKNLGGLVFPSLNVWTGKRGSGKSTLLTQALIRGVEDGKKVFVYTGELSVELFKSWLYKQIATERHVISKYDEDKEYYTLPNEVVIAIDSWIKGAMWIYDDTTANDEETLIKLMEQAYERYDCRVFVLDNLTTIKLKVCKGGKFEAQSLFTDKVRQFVKRTKTNVNLVVHPRKGDDMNFDNDNVGGSGDITNLAYNVINIRRINDFEQDTTEKEIQTLKSANIDDCDCIAQITKNRYFGNTGWGVYNFSKKDSRFVPVKGAGNIINTWEQFLPNNYTDQLGKVYKNKNQDISSVEEAKIIELAKELEIEVEMF